MRVVGEQFAWTFFYERDGKEVASRQLHVPIDRQVKFTLQSKDVLHDFWVPAFRMKKDAVPGIDVTYTVTPNRLGAYPIVCAELCGLGHAVDALDAPSSRTSRTSTRWLAQARQARRRRAAGGGGGGGGETDGKAIFTSADGNCGACHTLADAGANGTIGPGPRQGARRQGRGLHQGVDRRSRARRSPTATRAGSCRRNFGQTLPPAQLDALVKYLSEVTKGG